MTAFFTNKILDITIAGGGTASRIVSRDEYQDARKLAIYTPHDIDSKTYTFMVTDDEDPTLAGSTWATLVDSSGTAIAPAAIDKAKIIDELLTFNAFYIKPSGAVTPAVAFKATKQWVAG